MNEKLGEDLSEGVHVVFGGDVLGKVRPRTITPHGGDVDHCSLALGHHCRQELVGFVIALAFLPPTNLVAEVGGRGDIDGDHILCNGNQVQVD